MKKIILVQTLTAICLLAGETEINSCLSCHGDFFEKSAMGVSKIVRDMPKEEIRSSLKGYLDDSYGGDKKIIMKIQLKRFDNIDNVTEKVFKVIDPEYEEPSKMIEGDKIEIVNSNVSATESYSGDSEIIKKVNLDNNQYENGLITGDPIVSNTPSKKPSIKVLDSEIVEYKTVREETGNSFIIEKK